MGTIKRTDSKAIQIKSPQMEEKGDNTRQGRRRPTIKRADAEAIQIKGPQGEAVLRQ